MKFLETYLAQPILCIFGLSLFVACWTMACAVTAHHQNEFRTLTQPNSIRCSSVHIFRFCFFTFYLALTFVCEFQKYDETFDMDLDISELIEINVTVKTTKIKLKWAWLKRIAFNQWKNHWKCYFDWLKFI